MGIYQEPDSEQVVIRDLGANASEASDRPPERTARARRRNPYFIAAWFLASLMVVLGAIWLVFFDRGMHMGPYASYVTIDAPTGFIVNDGSYPSGTNVLSNLSEAGPFLLVAGLFASVLLLALQGMSRSRTGPTLK